MYEGNIHYPLHGLSCFLSLMLKHILFAHTIYFLNPLLSLLQHIFLHTQPSFLTNRVLRQYGLPKVWSSLIIKLKLLTLKTRVMVEEARKREMLYTRCSIDFNVIWVVKVAISIKEKPPCCAKLWRGWTHGAQIHGMCQMPVLRCKLGLVHKDAMASDGFLHHAFFNLPFLMFFWY